MRQRKQSREVEWNGMEWNSMEWNMRYLLLVVNVFVQCLFVFFYIVQNVLIWNEAGLLPSEWIRVWDRSIVDICLFIKKWF